MVEGALTLGTGLSVIIPASNEAALIGGCLSALLESDLGYAEVIVVANGCTDDTAARAQKFAERFSQKGWDFKVLDLAEGGKLGALNAGDAAASGACRVYLDADVAVSRGLLGQIAQVLDSPEPRYASGQVHITGKGFVSRAYARFWAKVPFMADCVPGCGLFAVNAAGRARWGDFPAIISDDTFVRLSFAPGERIGVKAPYDWPIAEGFARLVRVRRRQDVGVEEIERLYPQLLQNDDKPAFTTARKLRLALRDPVGFAVYTSIALAVKLTKSQSSEWSRGR